MKNKYNIGDLLQVKHSKIFSTINDSDSYTDGEEEVTAGQFFLIINYGPRIKSCPDKDFGYTLLCQKSGTSSFWGYYSQKDNDKLISDSFKKVK